MRIGWMTAAVTCAMLSTSFATQSYVVEETLLGWSEDGEKFAVLARSQGDSVLEVRGRAAKPVASISSEDKGVPMDTDDTPGLARINVEKFPALKDFKLKRIDAPARKRFGDQLVAKHFGRRTQNRYSCVNGGWTLSHKGAAKPFHEVKATQKACFRVLGGYLHANGKHALVKVTEMYWHTDDSGSDSNDDTKFVLVDVPAKTP